MNTDLFEIGFFSIMFIILISLAIFVGWEVRGQIEYSELDNIVMVKRCGKDIFIENTNTGR